MRSDITRWLRSKPNSLRYRSSPSGREFEVTPYGIWCSVNGSYYVGSGGQVVRFGWLDAWRIRLAYARWWKR